MNIIILKWVLTNYTLLEVAQPDVTQTTVERCNLIGLQL